MSRILKYKLDVIDVQTIRIPVNAVLLSIIEQHDNIVAYVLVDEETNETVGVKFRVIGTGHHHSDLEGWTYLSTVSTFGGSLVWHIFFDSSSSFRG